LPQGGARKALRLLAAGLFAMDAAGLFELELERLAEERTDPLGI